MLLRFVFLLLYVAGSGAILWYRMNNPIRPKEEFVDLVQRPVLAIIWMWGITLWPLIGLLWLGIVPIPAFSVLMLGILIPLILFIAFIMWSKISPFSITMGLLVIVLLFTALILLFTLLYAFPLLQLLLFLIAITLPPLLSILLLLRWTPELIPTEPGEAHSLREAVGLLVGLFTTFPKSTWMVEDGKVETRIKGNPFLGAGPGWVMTEPHNAAVIKLPSAIRRIEGPGISFTEANELIHSVVDLRQQIRVTRVNAITKDGISVNLPIASIFQLGGLPETLANLEQPWPYHKSDIYKAAFAAEVNPAGKTPLEAHEIQPWEDLPLEIAKNQLKQVLIQYPLDGLYDATQAPTPRSDAIPRAMISGEVRAGVKETLEPIGFKIKGGGVGNKIVPVNEEVTQQRIEAWKARWIRQVMEWKGKAQAKRYEEFAKIRRGARVKLLSGMIEKMHQELQETDNPLITTNLLAYKLLESLENIARMPEVHGLLPDTAVPMLADLRQQTKEGK